MENGELAEGFVWISATCSKLIVRAASLQTAEFNRTDSALY